MGAKIEGSGLIVVARVKAFKRKKSYKYLFESILIDQ
jgi:hypothetical protein